MLLNGIMSHSGWFFPLVDPWIEQGFAVIGADRRGSGLNREARGDAPTAAAVIDDAMAIIDAAVPRGRPLILLGWCWGSILALNLLGPLGDRVTGLVLATPGLFPTQALKDAAHRHEARAEGAPQDEPAIRSPISETMFTKGPYLDAWILRDEERLERFTPRFRGHMGKLAMAAAFALRKLRVPTLLLLAQDDEATDNEAVDAAISKVPEGVIRRHVAPGGHAMQFDARTFMTDRVIEFYEELRS